MAVIGRGRERASVPVVTIREDSSAATERRSGRGFFGGVAGIGAALHAQHLRAEVGREPSYERAVEMLEAEDAPATHAGAALEQVDAPAALIAIGCQLRVAKDAEFRHNGSEERSAGRRIRACRPHVRRRSHHTYERAQARRAHAFKR